MTQHDRVRRSTDLPLFYGKPSKDTITPHQLVARVERAARIANWVNDIQKIDEFNLCLREEAIKWYDSLEYIPNFDMTWINVKTEFLKAFATHQTAMTLCVTMQGLKQGSTESVQLYYNRVTDTFTQMKYATPATVNTHQGDDATLHFDAIAPPLNIPEVDVPRNYADAFTNNGANQMMTYLMMILFIGGLMEKIRDEVMMKNPNNLQEALEMARNIETVLNKAKTTSGQQVTAITEEDDVTIVTNEEEMAQVNAINEMRRRQGKRPIRYKFRRDKKTLECFNCKRKGHFARECRLPKVSAVQQNPYSTAALN